MDRKRHGRKGEIVGLICAGAIVAGLFPPIVFLYQIPAHPTIVSADESSEISPGKVPVNPLQIVTRTSGEVVFTMGEVKGSFNWAFLPF